MAITKKEQAAIDADILRWRTAAALRWTAPVNTDVPPPVGSGTTAGYIASPPDYAGVRVEQLWSQDSRHGSGPIPPAGKYVSGSQNGKSLHFEVNAVPVPISPKLKLVKPTEAGLQAQLETLREQVAELKVWKDAAIARYPDLGVPPEVLRARAIVAKVMKESDDREGARDVELGKRDKTMILRAVLASLEEAA